MYHRVSKRRQHRQHRKSSKKSRNSHRRSLKGGVSSTGGNFIQIGPMQQFFTNPAGGISYGGGRKGKTQQRSKKQHQKKSRKNQLGGKIGNCLGGWFKNITNNASTA